MTAQDWAVILTAIGAGAIVKELGVWLIKALTGTAGRKRAEVDRIAAEVVAERKQRGIESDRADREASKRRRIEEYASQLRAAYYEAGRTPAAWPELENTLPRSEVNRIIDGDS